MSAEVLDDHALASECILEWKRSPALRAEFSGRFLSFYHYTKAAREGRAKIYGGVGSRTIAKPKPKNE